MDLLAFVIAPEPARKMQLFGWLHLTILFLTLAVPFALSQFTRRQQRPALARYLATSIAAILILNRIMAVSWGVHEHTITRWQDALPMHLCDWASCAVIIALVWRGQLAYELAYLWGLAGTFQAVLTPDLAQTFPNPFFIGFFVDHCGIIVSVLFMTWGLGMRPRPGSVLRVWGWTQGYVVCVPRLVDWLTRTNYGYLAAKPVCTVRCWTSSDRGRGTSVVWSCCRWCSSPFSTCAVLVRLPGGRRVAPPVPAS